MSCYYNRKALPFGINHIVIMTNDKTRTRGGGRDYPCGIALRGCWASLSGKVTSKASPMVKQKYCPVRVRMGHGGPPAFAMQSRHVFCIFGVDRLRNRCHTGCI